MDEKRTAEEVVRQFLQRMGKRGHKVVEWMRTHSLPNWHALEARVSAEGLTFPQATELFGELTGAYYKHHGASEWSWIRLVPRQDRGAKVTGEANMLKPTYRLYHHPMVLALIGFACLLVAMLIGVIARSTTPRILLGSLVFVGLLFSFAIISSGIEFSDYKRAQKGKGPPEYGEKAVADRVHRRWRRFCLASSVAVLLLVLLLLPAFLYRTTITRDLSDFGKWLGAGGPGIALRAWLNPPNPPLEKESPPPTLPLARTELPPPVPTDAQAPVLASPAEAEAEKLRKQLATTEAEKVKAEAEKAKLKTELKIAQAEKTLAQTAAKIEKDDTPVSTKGHHHTTQRRKSSLSVPSNSREVSAPLPPDLAERIKRTGLKVSPR
jgi:hypothetical protein